MPELPEVETTRRGVEPHLINRQIIQAIIRHAQLRWAIPASFKKQVEHQIIQSVERRGKYLILHLQKGDILIHLGMSGRLRMLPEAHEPEKHDHVDLVLDNHSVLRYTDPRRFGAVLWTEFAASHVLIKNLGTEPLAKEFNTVYLVEKLQKKSIAIKLALMDSKVVVGVGNIYANEALFMAGILPQRPAKSLSKVEVKKLVTAVKKVLQAAIKKGGTTLRDYYSADGSKGFFLLSLKVYGRGGKACPKCGGLLIESRLGQRTTVFCCHCQK